MELERFLFDPLLWGMGLAMALLIAFASVLLHSPLSAGIAGIGAGIAIAGLLNCRFAPVIQ